MRIPQDIIIGAAMLGVAVLFWLEAGKIRISPLDGPVGAAGLPKTLAWALGILAVILILRSLAFSLLARKKAGATAEPGKGLDWRPHLRAAGMLAIGVGYLLILNHVGYIAAIMALLLAASLYIGATPSAKTLIFAVVGAVLFYFLFVRFLGIRLPPGIVEGLFQGA